MTGPLPEWLRPITHPAAWVYGRVLAVRNARFDRGVGMRRVDVPVVSVGNVTVGGVGKSPFVVWLAARLADDGLRCAVAMRGYGAPAGGTSDEAAEYDDRVPDLDIVVGADRWSALSAYLPDHPEIDVVLMDDGFQHRRLHRDLDIVLVDAARPGLNGPLLPAGYLREPARNLCRADAVVITRAETEDAELADAVTAVHGRPPLAWSRHVWSRVDLHHGADRVESVEPSWLDGRRVVAMFGVGNADAVAAQVARHGATIVDRVPARDHQQYTLESVGRLVGRIRGGDAMIVTGKDWVKLRDLIDLATWPLPVAVPIVEIDVWRGRETLLDLVRGVARRA